MRTPVRSKLRIGLVGCGAIASYAHLRLLRGLRGVELAAVADPAASARERAQRVARVSVHERAEELLAREDIDAVVICAPTPTHAELALAAVKAGKPFYLEKPIAANVSDARRVVIAAEEAGLAAAIGFNRRFHPLYQQARQVLDGGRIGAVHAVTMAFCEPRAVEEMPEWTRRRSSGGGALLDLASHHIDSLRWLLRDEVDEIAAVLSSEESEDDSATIALSMRGGTESRGLFSFRTGFADDLEFIGDRGTLRVDRFRRSLMLSTRRSHGYGLRRSWIRPDPAVAAWRLARPFRRVREVSFRRSLEAFAELARGSRQRGASLEDGLRCLEVIERAEAAAVETGELNHLAAG